VGNRGTGHLALDAHVALHALIKLDTPSVLGQGGMHYEGPLMNVPDLDVHVAAQTAFDPFLIGGMTTATGPVPETPLPPIPLMPATGIPGTLNLTITGTMTSTFNGTCAAVSADGTAVYLGEVATSADLVVHPTIVFQVPGFSRSVTLPNIPVHVDGTRHALDLGMHHVNDVDPAAAMNAGGSMATQGTCDSAVTPEGDDPSRASDGGTDSGSDDASVTTSPPVSSCNPATCDGCCQGDRCITGTTASACGTGGLACRACAPNLTCGPTRTCGPDAAAHWVLVAASASVEATNSSGGAWDSNDGLPDPYVCLTVAGARHCSPNQSNTTSASWSYNFPTLVSTGDLANGVRVQMYDADGVLNADDTIGDVTVTPSNSEFSSGIWSVTVGRSRVQMNVQAAR
jgi:hypothetical protein